LLYHESLIFIVHLHPQVSNRGVQGLGILIVQGFLIVIPLLTVAACTSGMKPHSIFICSFNSGKYFFEMDQNTRKLNCI